MVVCNLLGTTCSFNHKSKMCVLRAARVAQLFVSILFFGGYLWMPRFSLLARPSIRVLTNSCILILLSTPLLCMAKCAIFCLLVIESPVLVQLRSHRRLLSAFAINANSTNSLCSFLRWQPQRRSWDF